MNLRLIRTFSASIELLIAASLWGLGFVAILWALRLWSPAQVLFLRFAVGAGAGFAISAFGKWPSRRQVLNLVYLSFVPSIFLMLMLLFQTWGLRYTTATKSGFITILYVVIVPLVESLVERKRIPAVLWLFIAIALAGVILIVDLRLNTKWNFGDAMTLICALAASGQILSLDKASRRISHPFLFNCFQSVWCCFFAGILLPLSGPFPFDLTAGWMPWMGLLILGFGGTLIAFYFQIRAQKILSPTVSSLFFLLESPFALLFAVLLLGEHLSSREAWGAVLIFSAAILATLRESRRKKN